MDDKEIEEELYKLYFWSDVVIIVEEMDFILVLELFRFLMISFILLML